MNTKFKVALLTLLGFSASACCGTKKVAKSEDKKEQDVIINEESDPRIHLMYGVPFPDGSIVRPVEEDGKALSPRNGAKSEGAKLPNGSVAIPVSEEDAKERMEILSKEDIDDAEPTDMVLE
jgi:hypothetical protein